MIICPACGGMKSKVIDKRDTRRRRQCVCCGYRFTTYEVPAETYKKGTKDASD